MTTIKDKNVPVTILSKGKQTYNRYKTATPDITRYKTKPNKFGSHFTDQSSNLT